MENPASAPSAPDRYPRVAGPMHTILVLAVLGGWALWHKISADHSSAGADTNRVHYYVVTILFEWLLVALVVAGVRRSGGGVFFVFWGDLGFPLPGAWGICVWFW